MRDASASTLVSSLRSRYEWFSQRVDSLADAASHELWRYETDARRRTDDLASRLGLAAASLASACDARRHAVDRLAEAMSAALKLRLVRTEASLGELASKLSVLSPYSVLDRGYSLTTDESGVVLKDASSVSPGSLLHTRLAKGAVVSVVR